MNEVNIEPLRRILRDDCFRDFCGFVSRVVKHLDLELLVWIVKGSDCFQQTIDDVKLVEEWKLDRDHRQISFCVSATRLRHEVSIAPEVDDLLDAISAVDGERKKNGEI